MTIQECFNEYLEQRIGKIKQLSICDARKDFAHIIQWVGNIDINTITQEFIGENIKIQIGKGKNQGSVRKSFERLLCAIRPYNNIRMCWQEIFPKQKPKPINKDKREYWTYVDDSNNHYMISNFGRVMNSSSGRLLNPTWNETRKDWIFNISYKDCPRKKMFLKRAIMNHFGSALTKKDTVYICDGGKNPSLDNLIVKIREKKTKKQDNEKPLNKKSQEIWNIATTMCQSLYRSRYQSICNGIGLEENELINETLTSVMIDFENGDEKELFKLCCKKMKGVYLGWKHRDDDILSVDRIAVGINYDQDENWG